MASFTAEISSQEQRYYTKPTGHKNMPQQTTTIRWGKKKYRVCFYQNGKRVSFTPKGWSEITPKIQSVVTAHDALEDKDTKFTTDKVNVFRLDFDQKKLQFHTGDEKHFLDQKALNSLQPRFDTILNAVSGERLYVSKANRWPLYDGTISKPQAMQARDKIRQNKSLNVSTIDTAMHLVQAKEARAYDNFFYYQSLEDKNIKIENVKIDHPDLDHVPEIPTTGQYFLTLKVTKHVVGLVLDFDDDRMMFYDSNGNGLEHYPEVKTLYDDLKAKYFNDKTIEEKDNKGKGHQTDNHNCGRYLMEFFMKMAEHRDYERFTSKKITAEEIEKTGEAIADMIMIEAKGPTSPSIPTKT